MHVPGTRIILALLLMASAAGAHAECTPSVAASNARSACARDFSAQSPYLNRPNIKTGSSNAGLMDTRSAVTRAPAAAGQPRVAEFESPVAQSLRELPWAESRDWIHNPPEWLRDIKDHRHGAPVPLLHLWQSEQTQTLIALGVNHRGQPGLFISRKLPY
jgi:hypothetical protein